MFLKFLQNSQENTCTNSTKWSNTLKQFVGNIRTYAIFLFHTKLSTHATHAKIWPAFLTNLRTHVTHTVHLRLILNRPIKSFPPEISDGDDIFSLRYPIIVSIFHKCSNFIVCIDWQNEDLKLKRKKCSFENALLVKAPREILTTYSKECILYYTDWI